MRIAGNVFLCLLLVAAGFVTGVCCAVGTKPASVDPLPTPSMTRAEFLELRSMIQALWVDNSHIQADLIDLKKCCKSHDVDHDPHKPEPQKPDPPKPKPDPCKPTEAHTDLWRHKHNWLWDNNYGCGFWDDQLKMFVWPDCNNGRLLSA